ncbi:MAG TPA: GIY-YIG nuclease family protein [Massilibacterium sp.]|nr:GIY-YIG nuclease family protein [Massilibacterium sp.]
MKYYYETEDCYVLVESPDDVPDHVNKFYGFHFQDYFENCDHYVNYCAKIVRENIPNVRVTRSLKKLFKRVYNAYDQENFTVEGKIKSCPHEALSYRLVNIKTSTSFKNLIDTYKTRLEYGTLGENPTTIHRESEFEYQFTGFSIDYPEDLDRPGVYFIYDKNKDLIYIGKSISLRSRVISSLRERGGSYCRFAFTENEADATIYEVYYITKLSPPLNKQFSDFDKPTINIEEIELTDFIKVEKQEHENAQV